jgi:hypothetical protein
VVIEDLNKVPVFAPALGGRPWCCWCTTCSAARVRGGEPAGGRRDVAAGAAAARVYRRLPVQAVSESTADDLVRRGFDATASGHRERRRPGVLLAGPRRRALRSRPLLYLGRLKKYKRVDLVIRAVARLRDTRRPAGWSSRGRATRGAARAARGELGWTTASSSPASSGGAQARAVPRSWVHVLTSPKEGWGISNMEAAACGTATVASDSPGLRDSVRDGETGYLVPHGDVDALADRLRAMLQDPALRDRLGAGARVRGRLLVGAQRRETEAHLERVSRGGLTRRPHSSRRRSEWTSRSTPGTARFRTRSGTRRAATCRLERLDRRLTAATLVFDVENTMRRVEARSPWPAARPSSGRARAHAARCPGWRARPAGTAAQAASRAHRRAPPRVPSPPAGGAIWSP